jgi:hypothetical protein
MMEKVTLINLIAIISGLAVAAVVGIAVASVFWSVLEGD